jgi:hypothetical protein
MKAKLISSNTGRVIRGAFRRGSRIEEMGRDDVARRYTLVELDNGDFILTIETLWVPWEEPAVRRIGFSAIGFQMLGDIVTHMLAF